jgi:hypothetical protein
MEGNTGSTGHSGPGIPLNMIDAIYGSTAGTGTAQLVPGTGNSYVSFNETAFVDGGITLDGTGTTFSLLPSSQSQPGLYFVIYGLKITDEPGPKFVLELTDPPNGPTAIESSEMQPVGGSINSTSALFFTFGPTPTLRVLNSSLLPATIPAGNNLGDATAYIDILRLN